MAGEQLKLVVHSCTLNKGVEDSDCTADRPGGGGGGAAAAAAVAAAGDKLHDSASKHQQSVPASTHLQTVFAVHEGEPEQR